MLGRFNRAISGARKVDAFLQPYKGRFSQQHWEVGRYIHTQDECKLNEQNLEVEMSVQDESASNLLEPARSFWHNETRLEGR